ncbi:enterobactin synthase subunit EntD [Enterobacter hormaechei]|uniref:enterobactin synthase subunit EntD n=1 Tax=Enterobacter cloacae complex TaxID=354276 RepID=UPI0003BEB039|nr:enterobactin synthase subunit EntD [Enterobacter hormaechei]EKS6720835.1 enterobactin synthase subunit EntD [Enterobacter hormaechei]ESL78362.1 enterobactin synthetase component D [Enterobacter hormaechei]KTI47542.1 enterobactin synthase [Enterobacter hormaechei subsp. steigerwaltii]MBG0609713.1 enterobactin synthase subunit EntD [Enterobacter hormaechei]MCE1436741.1 enterobactin synthase subunit EntD [Enterobacter hormaechei]
MHTTHSTFSLAGHTLHRITFDPATFTDADLLWLPHHAQLADAGRKRKADHLAGRIAAAHALPDHTMPAIGPSGEPLWPQGISGSITHSGTQAIAVVTQYPALIGIDCETILFENEAREIKDGIIDTQEEPVLSRQGYPFALALTLVFSAKESLFKALFPQVQAWMGFDCARVTRLDDKTLTLALTRQLAGFEEGTAFPLHWQQHGEQVITLLSHAPGDEPSRWSPQTSR